MPGYEILSQCGDDQTIAVARHLANSLELDRRLMPPGSWGDFAVPLTFILFDFKPVKSIAPFVPKALESKDGSDDFGIVIKRHKGHSDEDLTIVKRQLDDDIIIANHDFDRDVMIAVSAGIEKTGGVDTGDDDTHCVVQNRWNAPWNWSGGVSGRGPIPLGLFFRLNRAIPPMPRWFEYGLLGPCGLLRLKPVRDPHSKEYLGKTVMSAATWLTDADTASLINDYRNDHKIPVIPPVGELFHPGYTQRQSSSAVWPSAEYMAEAALFIRWGMMPVAEVDPDKTTNLAQPFPEKGTNFLSSKEADFLNEAHQKAFARFLDRSRTEPVTEAVFRECFGFGYVKLQSLLAEYLVTTAKKPFFLNSHSLQGWSPDEPVAPIRAATADEIGRIIGDWLRMQADSFPNNRPAERAAYLKAAGRVLENAFREDNQLSRSVPLLPPKDAPVLPSEQASEDAEAVETPVAISAGKIPDRRLLAVYGLYYFDIGDSRSAHVLLEATTQAGTPRPAAYIAFAQLNRDAALAKPLSDNGKFSATQVAAILSPLFIVIKNWNLDVGGYLLIADTWSHSATKPSLANLQVLGNGVHDYPFDSSLLCAAAELYAQWGYLQHADEIVERSLRFVDRATAEKLRIEQSSWCKSIRR